MDLQRFLSFRMEKDFLTNIFKKSFFCFTGIYGVIGILTNPFFLIRKNLYHNINELAAGIKGKVLDFGCGSKPYRNLFVNCDEYIGCDIEVSGHSHENENVDVYYDGKTLPFKDNTFDGVVSSEVFEHVFNLEDIVKELNRVLKTGGEMLVTVPFVWNEHEIPYDFGRYTSFGISAILERNGFEVMELRKSTTYVEALATMEAEYIRSTLAKYIKNYKLMILCNMVFIAPISFCGLMAGKILPNNETWFCESVVKCRKIR